MAVHLENRYSCLSSIGADSLPGGSKSSRASGTQNGPGAQKCSKKRRAIVIGDSTVRGSDWRFCGRSRETRMIARVSDVSERVEKILKREGEEPNVVVHIGTNDIGRKREEDLKGEFRGLGGKVKEKDQKSNNFRITACAT